MAFVKRLDIYKRSKLHNLRIYIYIYIFVEDLITGHVGSTSWDA
jgi:hypothetical protein